MNKKNNKKQLSESSIELLKLLKGCEVRTQEYETFDGVVGVELNKQTQQYEAISGGVVMDTLDSDQKVKSLWKDYCKEEGF